MPFGSAKSSIPNNDQAALIRMQEKETKSKQTNDVLSAIRSGKEDSARKVRISYPSNVSGLIDDVQASQMNASGKPVIRY